ncbi:MAG: 30S ribosomal protein S2 [Bacteroidetes bacterium GWF2_40_14]|nr:MAG: 30S ribosomal protein S2 [Bacteroidetes bacterium GWF2_40_14]
MPRTNFQDLLDAGVHFGHLKRKWNPKMAPYIFMEKNGIHIIDLHKTVIKIDEAANVMKQLARSGRKILFVATKKQAKDIVADNAKAVNMPYVTERWPGGMLTNFPTIRKAVKKMNTIDKMLTDGTFETLAKRERLQVTRQRAKLEKNLGSIADLNRLPSALFIIDIQKEMNAVKEANRLNIPVIAMVDTCCDPGPIDFVIPANDDAAKSIALVMDILCKAISEGLSERKLEKDKEGPAVDSSEAAPDGSKKMRTRKSAQKPEIDIREAMAAAAPVVAEVAPVVAEVTPVVAEVAPVVAEVAPVIAEVAPAVEVAEVAAEEAAPEVAEDEATA